MPIRSYAEVAAMSGNQRRRAIYRLRHRLVIEAPGAVNAFTAALSTGPPEELKIGMALIDEKAWSYLYALQRNDFGLMVWKALIEALRREDVPLDWRQDISYYLDWIQFVANGCTGSDPYPEETVREMIKAAEQLAPVTTDSKIMDCVMDAVSHIRTLLPAT